MQTLILGLTLLLAGVAVILEGLIKPLLRIAALALALVLLPAIFGARLLFLHASLTELIALAAALAYIGR
jgi:hypothetical protein